VSPEIFGWWRTHSFKDLGRDFMCSVAWSPKSGFLKFYLQKCYWHQAACIVALSYGPVTTVLVLNPILGDGRC
jgi:hypothetical protein